MTQRKIYFLRYLLTKYYPIWIFSACCIWLTAIPVVILMHLYEYMREDFLDDMCWEGFKKSFSKEYIEKERTSLREVLGIDLKSK